MNYENKNVVVGYRIEHGKISNLSSNHADFHLNRMKQYMKL